MKEMNENEIRDAIRAPLNGPLLTSDLPGIGGVLKERNQDFLVEEMPLYPFSGEGTHIFFQVEKDGLDTQRAVRSMAQVLGCRVSDLGYAGLKDAHAITRQWFSLEHADEKKIADLKTGQLRVIQTTRHTNKLKVGHLAGNQFTIRIRQYDRRDTLARARAIGAVLSARGVPNYFGPQRFGVREDTQLTGRALLLGNYDEAVQLILGRGGPKDTGKVRQARDLFDAGKLEQALEMWPYPFATERMVLRTLLRKGGRASAAIRAVREQQRTFFISAYQSALFNAVLAERIRLGWFDQLLPGDLAYKHVNGAVFHVEDAEKEQPRVLDHEISPTGPLLGYRGSLAEGEPGELEQAVLKAEGLSADNWRVAGRFKIKGDRRPVRFLPRDLALGEGSDEFGPFIECRFYLPKGSYATCLLAELCKTKVSEEPEEEEMAEESGAEPRRQEGAKSEEASEGGGSRRVSHPLAGTGKMVEEDE